MMSRTFSMPRLLAASISMTSMSSPRAIAVHELHLPQGLGVGASNFSQFSALARMRAIDVLPTPRVPQKRKACAIRRAPQVILPDDIIERRRPVSAGKDCVSHVV